METPFTYSQFIILLNSSEKNDALIKSYLKNYNDSDVRLLGAKAFMEVNVDINLLKQFLAYEPVSVKSTPDSSYRHKKNTLYKMAASVVLLLGLSIVCYQLFHKNETDTMLSYYTKDVGLPVMMGNNDHSRFDEAMNYYKQEDYLKTNQLLQKLNTETPNNDTVTFYLGEVCVLSKAYVNAKQHYQAVLPGSTYYAKAQFKLALMLYISNDKEKAKQVFTSLLSCSDNELALASATILKEVSF